MKKIICLILTILLVSTVTAIPTSKEVTGQTCGKYLVLPSPDKGYTSINKVTYNLDWDCFCPDNWNKIPIWSVDQETGEHYMAFTCKK